MLYAISVLYLYLCLRLQLTFFLIENLARNVSARTKRGPFSEQRSAATPDASASGAKREREIKRDRTRRAGPFRGWADERIVNSIYRAPQIRLTSSLAIKMIVEPPLTERADVESLLLFIPFDWLFAFQKYSSLAVKGCR